MGFRIGRRLKKGFRKIAKPLTKGAIGSFIGGPGGLIAGLAGDKLRKIDPTGGLLTAGVSGTVAGGLLGSMDKKKKKPAPPGPPPQIPGMRQDVPGFQMGGYQPSDFQDAPQFQTLDDPMFQELYGQPALQGLRQQLGGRGGGMMPPGAPAPLGMWPNAQGPMPSQQATEQAFAKPMMESFLGRQPPPQLAMLQQQPQMPASYGDVIRRLNMPIGNSQSAAGQGFMSPWARMALRMQR